MKLIPNAVFALGALLACVPSQAQIFTFTRDQMIKYTAQNPFDRFEDGRPKAPDALLERRQRVVDATVADELRAHRPTLTPDPGDPVL